MCTWIFLELLVTKLFFFGNNVIEIFYNMCHNLTLRLTTKAGACNGVGQEGSLGITTHAPGSVKESEGMNPHTLK
jgi:hypothetical protein